jgi:hypothetical protein
LAGCSASSLRPNRAKRPLETIGEKAIALREKAEETADRLKSEMLGPLSSTENLDADYTPLNFLARQEPSRGGQPLLLRVPL